MREQGRPGRPKGSKTKTKEERANAKKPRLGRPKVNKKRQRMGSPFIKKGVEEINLEIRDAYGKLSNTDKFWDTIDKITVNDAEDVFNHFKGRCAYCNQRLSYLGRKSIYAAILSFYTPLKLGGEARYDNLIVVCARCKHDYRTVRMLKEDIIGIDSFADLCEALFVSVRDRQDEVVRRQIKNMLNMRLSDIANCMKYKITSDVMPEKMEMIMEDENTIGERLDQLANGKDTKNEITNDMKQIIKTKQYKIIRNPRYDPK